MYSNTPLSHKKRYPINSYSEELAVKKERFNIQNQAMFLKWFTRENISIFNDFPRRAYGEFSQKKLFG